MQQALRTLILSGSLLVSMFSCQKSELTETPQQDAAAQLNSKASSTLSRAQGCFNATYIDTIHYSTPQLYIFNGTQYARYDVLTNTFQGTNSITNGYAGVPFSTFDASYVDTWHYGSAQLYIFSGTQYARYDMTTNQFKGTNSIANGYPGVPFTTIDASYVDVYNYNGRPKLYLFSGNQYARYDVLSNTYEGATSISNYPGMPFSSIDAAYIDKWHYNGRPQLYLFSGGRYARWDILSNTYHGTNTTTAGYPGVPFCR